MTGKDISGLVIGLVALGLGTAQTARAQAAPSALEAAIAESHKALASILSGDPSGYRKLVAERADITLGNPFGPYARGPAEVAKTLAGAAAKYHDGVVLGVDRVALYLNADFACVVEVEHDRAKVGASEAPADFNVRVTSVYQRGGGGWRLEHRHADPITTARPAESVLAK